jgi:hypothetical protein
MPEPKPFVRVTFNDEASIAFDVSWSNHISGEQIILLALELSRGKTGDSVSMQGTKPTLTATFESESVYYTVENAGCLPAQLLIASDFLMKIGSSIQAQAQQIKAQQGILVPRQTNGRRI